MSKRAEWEATQGERPTHVLEVGPVSAWVCPNWSATKALYAFEVDERGSAPDVDRAKELAEGKLREMRDALNEHFAPVLRWVDSDCARPESIASVCGWDLHAAHGNWALQHASGATVYSPRPNQASRENNRLAAEAALRALGVVFRTEGE